MKNSRSPFHCPGTPRGGSRPLPLLPLWKTQLCSAIFHLLRHRLAFGRRRTWVQVQHSWQAKLPWVWPHQLPISTPRLFLSWIWARHLTKRLVGSTQNPLISKPLKIKKFLLRTSRTFQQASHTDIQLLPRASPNANEAEPEILPRVPQPPRCMKTDYRRRWTEVTSSTYGDEDRPPKVPPREPLSQRSHRVTPADGVLKASVLLQRGHAPHTVLPLTPSISSGTLHRQNSEGSAHRVPRILPITENVQHMMGLRDHHTWTNMKPF